LSDADGWGSPWYYSTLRISDISGDGKADVCARGGFGLHCWLSTGSGFGEVITLENLSDANGWGVPEYYTTVRLADIDGNGTADACARSSAGIHCWPFDGTAFGEQIDGPPWSNDSGWAGVPYYSTLHIAGGCIKSTETCNGKDDDCDGEVDEGCDPGSGGAAGNGSAGTGWGGGSAGSNSADSSGDEGGCGCTVGARSAAKHGWLLLVGLALAARVGRRRLRRRALL
jgi:MYXO-CTERM domain-containing protein